MLPPLIQRRSARNRSGERGITLALVALAIFSIVAMAGLSIDIGTLYQASAEAQRSADAAALAAARVLSLSGMTGDPSNSSKQWTNACTLATQTATAVASQNLVGGAAPTASVTFLSSDSSNCTTVGAFGVNPMVTVKVTQSSLPTYFARIWGRRGNSVSATATAEAFNPSNSGAYSSSTDVVPVQPRCVKPWIVPNLDPGNLPGTCPGTGACPTFVGPLTGTSPSSITNGGILVGGVGTGVIGETFNLVADCGASPGNCKGGAGFINPPAVNPAGSLQYLPGQVLGTPVAVPGCVAASPYQGAIAGCDQSTPYQCGVQSSSLGANASQVDFTENPSGPSGDTSTAAQCLIQQAKGQDGLNISAYPYQIQAGSGNPLKVTGSVITSSNSIVSLPIYDATTLTIKGNEAAVTIVGFLQVFINFVDTTTGNLNVTVLNVAGCGNSATSTSPFVTGTSPVPVRLITPPSS
jgi:Flp pilus assembly protein TadG